MKTDIRRFCVVAKRAGVTVGTLIVTGENNVPAAKAKLAFDHLGSDDIAETVMPPLLHLVPPPEPAPTKPESIADLLHRVLGTKP